MNHTCRTVIYNFLALFALFQSLSFHKFTFFESAIINSGFAFHPFQAKTFIILLASSLPSQIEQRGLHTERFVSLSY